MNSQGYYTAPDPSNSDIITHRIYELHWTLHLFVIKELGYPLISIRGMGTPVEIVAELFGILALNA